MTIDNITLVTLQSVWQRISGSVVSLMTPGEVGRLIEACDDGRALVFANDEGVVIVTLQVADMEFELLVVVAVGVGERLFDRYMPFLETLAVDLDARRIVFEPRRRGWARRLRGSEWTLRQSDGMYVLEVGRGGR
jgi:hypothetical protein